MAVVFWGVCGIIPIDFFEKRQTNYGENCGNLLDSFNDDVNEKCQQLA